MILDYSDQVNKIKQRTKKLIEPLEEKIYKIKQETNKKIRNLYDKELRNILISEGVNENKLENYEELLNDYYDVFELEIDAITLEELQERIKFFIVCNT